MAELVALKTKNTVRRETPDVNLIGGSAGEASYHWKLTGLRA